MLSVTAGCRLDCFCAFITGAIDVQNTQSGDAADREHARRFRLTCAAAVRARWDPCSPSLAAADLRRAKSLFR